MRAGLLDRRITIEAKTSTVDADYGTEVVTWTTFASRISASVMDVLPSKSEGAAEGLVIANSPARIRIRYRANVTSDMRIIVHNETDRLMQIVAGPSEIGRREGIELMATEYSTEGGD